MRQITMRGAVLASAMALGATITGCGTSGADTERETKADGAGTEPKAEQVTADCSSWTRRWEEPGIVSYEGHSPGSHARLGGQSEVMIEYGKRDGDRQVAWAHVKRLPGGDPHLLVYVSMYVRFANGTWYCRADAPTTDMTETRVHVTELDDGTAVSFQACGRLEGQSEPTCGAAVTGPF